MIHFVSKAYLLQSVSQDSQSFFELLHSYILTSLYLFLLRQKLQLLIDNNTFLPSCFFKFHLTEKCWPNDSDFLKNGINRIMSLKNRSAAITKVLWILPDLYCPSPAAQWPPTLQHSKPIRTGNTGTPDGKQCRM